MNLLNALKQNHRSTIFATVTAAMALLTGCIQSSAAEKFAYPDQVDISETAIRAVNTSFQMSFSMGGWYYKGAEAMNGTINAYIQIPNRLDMSQSDQKNYLRQSICPSAHQTEFWQQLKGIPLSVHIYTFNKKFTVYAHCENPTV